MADSKLTALTALTDPQLTDLLYMVDDPGGTPLSKKATVQDVLALSLWAPPEGMRLSASTNTYVTTSDVTAAGTIYWTPVISGGHGTVTGYNGTVIASKSVTQKSLALTVTSGKNYDVFYDYDGDVLALSAAWTTDTARADALADEQGAIVLGSDHTKLWLGTIRASGSNVTEDSGGGVTNNVGGKRFIWNKYNQMPRSLKVIETDDSWSYTTGTIRQANGEAGNKVEYVAGENILITASIICGCYVTANVNDVAFVCVGVDSTSTYSGFTGYLFTADVVAAFSVLSASYEGFPGLGYHYLSWNENGADNVCVFLGSSSGVQAGVMGVINA